MSISLRNFTDQDLSAHLTTAVEYARATLEKSGLGPKDGADLTDCIVKDKAFRTHRALLTPLVGDAYRHHTREGAMASNASTRPAYYALAAVAANCVRFPGGGASPTLEAEVAMAEAALGRLFGDEVAFFPEDDATADEWELEEDREDAELLAGILAGVSKPAAAEAGAATGNEL